MSWASGLTTGQRMQSSLRAPNAFTSRRCRSVKPVIVGRATFQQSYSWIGDFRGQCQITSPSTSGQSRGHRQITRMGKNAKDGPFTPIVVVVRNQLGTKEFNQLRGKAISIHSQLIKDFGKQIGAEAKQVQGIIRLAKQNGEKLGFLS